MNQELKTAYNKLSAIERDHLRQEFANSPKILLLLNFLEELKGIDFSNQQVIPYIYGAADGSFETLRNRYFKLRKSVLGSIQQLGKSPEGGHFNFPDEQAELYHIKNLIKQDGQYGTARLKLEPLVKKLWQENLFEILPDAIQSLMYCRQVLGDYHQNSALYQQWELAIEVQKDLNQVRMLSTKALNGYHEGGFPKVLETMMLMKKIVQKRKDCPRFQLCYHLSHVLNGAATMGNKLGALTRHIKQFEALRKQYPNMPSLYYETNHLWTERFRYLYAKGLYNYMKEDIRGFYKHQAEAYHLTQRIPELKGARSEGMFMNKIRTEVLLGLYHEAQQTASHMQAFQKEHKLLANSWKTMLELGRMYVYSYPKVKPENLKLFLDTLERNLKNVAQAMSEAEKGEATGVLAILRFYNQEYKTALKLYEKPETQQYFNNTGIGVFHKVFLLPYSNGKVAIALAKEIKKLMHQNDNLTVRNLITKAVDMVAIYQQHNLDVENKIS